MFPVSDVIPSRTRPVVTLALVLVISGAFAHQLQLTDLGLASLFDRSGVSSDAISSRRLLVGLFLHAGWVHFAVNVWALWLFGPSVENAFRRLWFLLFYIGAGVLAALVQAVAHPPVAGHLVGASGPIAAVLGAYLVLYPQSRLLTIFLSPFHLDVIEIPAVAFVGVWFVLQLAGDIASLGIPVTAGAQAFWSHLSGFAIGMLCGGFARWRGVLGGYWASDRGHRKRH
jgi:membrane associated rhomboid family serine protease